MVLYTPVEAYDASKSAARFSITFRATSAGSAPLMIARSGGKPSMTARSQSFRARGSSSASSSGSAAEPLASRSAAWACAAVDRGGKTTPSAAHCASRGASPSTFASVVSASSSPCSKRRSSMGSIARHAINSVAANGPCQFPESSS